MGQTKLVIQTHPSHAHTFSQTHRQTAVLCPEKNRLKSPPRKPHHQRVTAYTHKIKMSLALSFRRHRPPGRCCKWAPTCVCDASGSFLTSKRRKSTSRVWCGVVWCARRHRHRSGRECGTRLSLASYMRSQPRSERKRWFWIMRQLLLDIGDWCVLFYAFSLQVSSESAKSMIILVSPYQTHIKYGYDG